MVLIVRNSTAVWPTCRTSKRVANREAGGMSRGVRLPSSLLYFLRIIKMTLEDLREQIQEDIIACCCACDHNLEGSELLDNLCQIVVDRFKEYDVSSSDITT